MESVRLSDIGHEEAARKAAAVLAAGGVVLYPTDTLYGLAVDATNPDALNALYTLKGRQPDKPVSIVVRSVVDMSRFAYVDEKAYALATKHLPGALTLVLPALPSLPRTLTPEGLVGMRIPDDPFCRALSAHFQHPYTATSANVSAEEPGATPEAILAQFKERADRIALVVDDGPREGGVPSTVVLLADGRARVLREGALSRADLGL